jgi:hypothetical protein
MPPEPFKGIADAGEVNRDGPLGFAWQAETARVVPIADGAPEEPLVLTPEKALIQETIDVLGILADRAVVAEFAGLVERDDALPLGLRDVFESEANEMFCAFVFRYVRGQKVEEGVERLHSHERMTSMK